MKPSEVAMLVVFYIAFFLLGSSFAERRDTFAERWQPVIDRPLQILDDVPLPRPDPRK